MVVILFGAYHVIYQRPDTPPPEVAKELDNLPDALELDLGTEVSAQDLLDELNEDSGLAEEDSLATAADNGQFESPAAGPLAEGTLAESTENSIEPAAEAPSTEQAASNLEMDNPLTDTFNTDVQSGAATESSQFVFNSEPSSNELPPAESNDGGDFQPVGDDAFPVSYTHLTLPTIYSV